MSRDTHDAPAGHNGQSLSFVTGLVTGALVGAAAGMLLAPRSRSAVQSLRGQVAESAAKLGKTATGRYRRASTQLGDAVQDLQDKSRKAYGTALTAIAAGAHQVEEHAAGARTALDRSAPEGPGRQAR